VTPHVTAVVTVADDGGSSGRLRDEMGALPPGDLRMALSALAGDDDWGRRWGDLLQHRFTGDGPLAGHAVGNLVLAGLAQVEGDPVAALDLVGRMIGAVGRVLPMSCEPLEIVAEVVGLDPADPTAVSEVVGQVAVATTEGAVAAVQLRPAEPRACRQAVEAVRAADWVVLGPGSWFTSVLPHLLVPDLREALVTTTARRLVALNLEAQAGRPTGSRPRRTWRCWPRTPRSWCPTSCWPTSTRSSTRVVSWLRSRRQEAGSSWRPCPSATAPPGTTRPGWPWPTPG
jgi:uncharacterized cofD-like protein